MSNIEQFPSWYQSIAMNSERTIAAAERAVLDLRGVADGHQPSEVGTTRGTLPAAAQAHDTWAYTTRRVDRSRARQLLQGRVSPRVGDLVLARVQNLGHHRHLQLVDGRRRRLFVGDLIIVAYGNRYACEQFEAEVPGSLAACHLVAGGGVAASALNWHDRIARGPTGIKPLGLVADEAGRPLNLRDFALEAPGTAAPAPLVISVLGTAMDAGKTETAAHLVRGLRACDRRVGYIKATGTGAGGDAWLLRDAGADHVLDFTDAGLPSTYRAKMADIEAGIELLIANMAKENIDVVVMEIADGVYQQETAKLIASPVFTRYVDGIVLAARDAMGATAGIQALSKQERPVLGLSGLLSASPLQRREAEAATGLPSYNREELASPVIAAAIARAASICDDREVAG